jgi:hypothetical protein
MAFLSSSSSGLASNNESLFAIKYDGFFIEGDKEEHPSYRKTRSVKNVNINGLFIESLPI